MKRLSPQMRKRGWGDAPRTHDPQILKTSAENPPCPCRQEREGLRGFRGRNVKFPKKQKKRNIRASRRHPFRKEDREKKREDGGLGKKW